MDAVLVSIVAPLSAGLSNVTQTAINVTLLPISTRS